MCVWAGRSGRGWQKFTRSQLRLKALSSRIGGIGGIHDGKGTAIRMSFQRGVVAREDKVIGVGGGGCTPSIA